MVKKISYEQLLKKVEKLEKKVAAHQKTEEALTECKRRYEGLRQASFEGVGIHEDGVILEVNQEMAKMTGYKISELIGMTVTTIIAPEWHDTVWKNIRSGYDKSYEVCMLKKGGTVFPVEVRGKNVFLKNRKLRAMSFRDITERKKVEEHYKMLADKSQAGMYIVQDGKFKFLNERAAKVAGYRPDELVGKTERSIIHPEDRKKVIENARSMLKGEDTSPIELRIVTKDGQTKWMMESITSIPYGGKPAILGNVMDISEFKEASEKLSDLEALEASILDAIPHAVLGLESRRVIFANNAVEAVLGWKPDELIGQKSRVFYQNDKDYNDIGHQFYDDKKKKKIHIERFPCRTKDGRDIICMVSASKFGEKTKEKVVAVYEDVTERVLMDEALHEERDRAQQYLDIAGTIILVLDTNGTVTLINQKGTEILRYNHDDIIDKNWFDSFIPKRIRSDVKSVFFRLVAGDIAMVEYFENPIITKHGRERIISWHNSLIRDDSDNIIGILSSGEDVTERKVAEEKLFEYSEKLRLMASELSLTEQRERQRIATELHDRIGQSMAVSKIKLEELRKELTASRNEKSVNEIIKLIDQLIYDTRSLTFELSPPVLYILGLDSALEWLAENFQEKHGVRTSFRKEGSGKKLDKDIAFFLFRGTQELLVNIAKHAKADSVSIHMRRNRGNIQVSVKDNGVGFDSKRIRLPGDARGGFGIFSIRERLNYLGGQFRVESKPGQGTNIDMIVPHSVPKRKRRGR